MNVEGICECQTVPYHTSCGPLWADKKQCNVYIFCAIRISQRDKCGFFVVLFFIGDNRISMSYSTRMIMQVFWLDISLFKEKIDLVIQSAVCLEARGEAAVYIPY